MSTTFNVSKVDAAKRQLEVAINLFFRGGDPVSIHTLTRAGFQVLNDLSTKQGIRTIHEQMIESIKPESRKLVRNKFSEARNFFKHANNDSDNLIKFNPELSEFFLWDACDVYKKLTMQKVEIFEVFLIYFRMKNKNIFEFSTEEQFKMNDAALTLDLNTSSPSSFIPLFSIMKEANYDF